jgi:hypothetical protein
MDKVVADALREVARAERALADAEMQLRQAWARRAAAFAEAGWLVVFAHDSAGIAPVQRVVVHDQHGSVVNVDRLAAVAAADDQ